MPGDYVLVRNVKEKGGTGKLRNYWKSNIFEVIQSNPSLPVYTVKNLHKTRDISVLHRNLLMRCNELPVEMFEQNRNIRGNRERPSGEVAEKSSEEDDNDDIVINNPSRLIEDRDRILDKESTVEEGEVEEGILLRRSSRRRIPTRRFTYHNVGRKPLLENTK